MKKNDIVVIPYGEHAKLNVRRDKIIATIHTPDSNKVDMYIEGVDHPLHITDAPADAVIGLIWGGDE